MVSSMIDVLLLMTLVASFSRKWEGAGRLGPFDLGFEGGRS